MSCLERTTASYGNRHGTLAMIFETVVTFTYRVCSFEAIHNFDLNQCNTLLNRNAV